LFRCMTAFPPKADVRGGEAKGSWRADERERATPFQGSRAWTHKSRSHSLLFGTFCSSIKPMAYIDEDRKLRIFISYSRKDSAVFVDELTSGLEYSGFAPFMDRHDIAAGGGWEARLSGLIEQSDTVVFVVSPEAVKSERCMWEVDRTIELSKRL